MLGVVFIWFIMALLGLLVGQRKGRPAAGFVWGALLGPFGWMLVWLGPDHRPTCPHCSAVLPDQAATCKACGNRLTWIRGRAVKPSRAVP